MKPAPPPPPAPSDVQNDPRDFASSMQGQLPRKKQKVSPFDRIGAKQQKSDKGKPPNGYAQ